MAEARFGAYKSLYPEEEGDYELLWYQGFGLWLTVALTLIIISSSVGIAFVLLRRWHRERINQRNNRRFHNGGIL